MLNTASNPTVESLVARSAHRTVTGLAVTLAILAGAAQAANAQTAQPVQAPNASWEFVMSSGALIPTGVQRSVVRSGKLSTAQLAYVVNPSLAITSTLGWGRSREAAAVGDNKFDAFTYDLGAEARLPRYSLGGSKTWSAFSGIGAGARSYNYRNLEVDATHDVSAYGSVGAELGVRRVRVRVEARDYVTRFKGLDGQSAANARNDVVILAGLRVVKR